MTGRDAAPTEPSQRRLRVGEEIRRTLARILERGTLHDPALYDAPVTISEVTVSPDLRNATVWITRLGGGDATELLAALKRNAGRLGGLLARDIKLKYAPRLQFARDSAFDTSSRIDALLRNPVVRHDIEAGPTEDTDSEEPDGPA
ncbi:30S ribosome-binding factor RbfA [Thalassobaculum sp.]|uniref:30S ribosome-binding factor RbfA n=1 Tax=Thalassobaculum sp. TaxID=2022740 RepID=UPI0032EB2458